MFRLFRSLAISQSAPLRLLFKASTFTPFQSFINKNLPCKNNSLSYSPSAYFSAFSSTKAPENQYMQDLQFVQGYSVEELGMFQQLLKRYIASKDFAADFTQDEGIVLLILIDQLAKNCFNFPNRGGDALKYYEEAFVIANAIELKESKDLGFLNYGSGYAFFRNHKLDEALENFGKSREIFEKVGLDNETLDPFIQSIYYQGVISYSQGKFDKAEEYFLAALEASEKIPEKETVEPLQLEIYINLAFANFKKKSFEKAHEYSLKAFDRIDKIYGEHSEKKIGLLRELASGFYGQRKFDDALQYFKKLNDCLKHNPGAPQNEVLESLVLIAKIYTEKRDPSNASIYYKQALDILPNNFPDAENLYFFAAESHFAAGKVQEAIEIFNKGMIFINNKHGENSFDAAFQLNSWGRALETKQDTKKDAYNAYKKSLEISQKLDGDHVIGMIHNSSRLADLARQLGNFEESVEYGKNALKLCTESGKNQHWLEDINTLLGSSLVKVGKEAEALKYFEEAARLCEKSGQKSGQMHYHYHMLADAYFRNKNMEKAEDAARKALELCALKFGKGNSQTQTCLLLLSKILNAQQKTDEVTKFNKDFGTK